MGWRKQGDDGKAGGNKGREGGIDGREEGIMMLGRERAHAEEGWIEGGNERERDGTRHGQREGKRVGRKQAEEGLSEEGREQGREENFKGVIPRRVLASVQNIHKLSHSAALGLQTLVFQMENSEQVYIINFVL